MLYIFLLLSLVSLTSSPKISPHTFMTPSMALTSLSGLKFALTGFPISGLIVCGSMLGIRCSPFLTPISLPFAFSFNRFSSCSILSRSASLLSFISSFLIISMTDSSVSEIESFPVNLIFLSSENHFFMIFSIFLSICLASKILCPPWLNSAVITFSSKTILESLKIPFTLASDSFSFMITDSKHFSLKTMSEKSGSIMTFGILVTFLMLFCNFIISV